MNNNIGEEFIHSWQFTRSQTIEILNSLNDEMLLYKPEGEKWKPLFWEFGCIGRTQIVYTEAVKSNKMDFSLFASNKLPKKTDHITIRFISDFLEQTNAEWLGIIRKKNLINDFIVKWPETKMSLPKHIASLAEHERIHHGQFIAYFTLAGFALPPRFKSTWAL